VKLFLQSYAFVACTGKFNFYLNQRKAITVVVVVVVVVIIIIIIIIIIFNALLQGTLSTHQGRT
jgi:competence protein ComGC